LLLFQLPLWLGLLLGAGRAVAQTAVEDAAPATAHEIVARAFENLYGYHAVQRFELRVRAGDGDELHRTGQVVRRGVDDATLNRSVTRLLSPYDVRGMAILMIEQPDNSYDAYLYQPAFRRVRRIGVAQRQQTFFGTDIVLEDMEAKRVRQWPPRLLREDRVDGRGAWVIELVTRDVVTEYERILGWFDRELPVLLRAEFFKNGKRLKTYEIEPDRIVEMNGYYIPMLQRFRGEQGSVTELETSEIDIRDELPEKFFTAQALEFGSDRWTDRQ
jgi:hypothetical protein